MRIIAKLDTKQAIKQKGCGSCVREEEKAAWSRVCFTAGQ